MEVGTTTSGCDIDNVDTENENDDKYAEFLETYISFDVTDENDNYEQGGDIMVSETIHNPNILSNNVDGEIIMPNYDNKGEGEYLTSVNKCCYNNNDELQSLLAKIKYELMS